MSDLIKSYNKVCERIHQACMTYDRDPHDVTLLVVTKMQGLEKIQSLYDHGHRYFAENYVQEWLDKKQELPSSIEWFFIGHLQSNKVLSVVLNCQWILGVDSLKLMRRLEYLCAEHDRHINICLQVNISDEEAKSGMSFTDIDECCLLARTFKYVNVRGLMAIPAIHHSRVDQQGSYQAIGELFAQKRDTEGWDTLSIGMSNDLEAAIASGSTMVRVGSAIMGERSKSS